MDEREAAHSGGLPARKITHRGFEIAGTWFQDSGDDFHLVTAQQIFKKQLLPSKTSLGGR
jgi:hypothetical protein